MKNKKLVLFLSLLFPGLGHLYLGQYPDGVVLAAATGFLWYAMLKKQLYLFQSDPRTVVFWLGFGAVYLIAVVSAYRTSKRGK